MSEEEVRLPMPTQELSLTALVDITQGWERIAQLFVKASEVARALQTVEKKTEAAEARRTKLHEESDRLERGIVAKQHNLDRLDEETKTAERQSLERIAAAKLAAHKAGEDAVATIKRSEEEAERAQHEYRSTLASLKTDEAARKAAMEGQFHAAQDEFDQKLAELEGKVAEVKAQLAGVIRAINEQVEDQR